MKHPKRNPQASDKLINRLETYLINPSHSSQNSFTREILELVEDLRIQQLKLEKQNDELKRAYEELEELKESYAYLYDFAPVGYLTLDENNLILEANLCVAELVGIERHRLLGRRFSQLISADCSDFFFGYRRKCLETREKRSCEIEIKGDRKTPIHVQVEGLAVPDDEGNFNRIQMILIDISERRAAREYINKLSLNLLKAQETERRIISRELHDRVAQELASAKIESDMLLKSTYLPADIKQNIENISEILNHSIASIRDLSYDLRPPALDQLGLIEAIVQHCSYFFQNTGVQVDFNFTGLDRLTLNSDTEINIYRIIQEGLNNIRKHADASRVTIMLISALPNIILRMEDNGRGFDLEKRMASLDDEKRMGLRSIEERARLLGGGIDIQSRPGSGTRVLIKFPFRR